MTHSNLDIICIGRAGVDLYGQQVGGRLEDMGSFAKYIGGSPANTAVGCARLGLKAALISRVGNEHMGRFIRESMLAEGVDTSHLKTDPDCLTALVLLGIQDQERFPLIFYRENCADMALCEDDIDESFIASARAVLVFRDTFKYFNRCGSQLQGYETCRQGCAGHRLSTKLMGRCRS